MAAPQEKAGTVTVARGLASLEVVDQELQKLEAARGARVHVLVRKRGCEESAVKERVVAAAPHTRTDLAVCAHHASVAFDGALLLLGVFEPRNEVARARGLVDSAGRDGD